MGKSSPKAPDPHQTAAAQAGANRDTAITQMDLNSVNQINPWGSVTYDRTGSQSFVDSQGRTVETPTYTQTTSFTPETQAIFDSYMGTMGNLSSLAQQQSARLGETLGNGVDMSGAPALSGSAGQVGRIGNGYDAQFGREIGGSFDSNFSGHIGNGYSSQLGPGYAASYAGADDFSADRQRYEDALWQRTAGDRAQSEAQMRATLANKGITEGSAAWNAEMERMGRQNTDARLATILAGGEEQARMVGLARDAAEFGNSALLQQGQFTNQSALAQAQFGSQQQAAGNASSLAAAQYGATAQEAQNDAALAARQNANQANLTNAQFGNSARDQYLGESMALRNQTLNEMGGLFGMGGSSLQSPGTYSGGTPQAGVAGTDIAGLINSNYQTQMAGYNSQVGAMGGLFGMLGMGAMRYSDERLKTDVRRVGTTDGGLPIYTYRYVWGGPVQMGVMAQDVEQVIPDAVAAHDSGFKMVDYARVA